uniref:Dynein heavy chain AAA module D4 domain-containing protein n=1 Tax=Panagrolaimus sp. ES5 TaxID=591445 RepID=A0AC34G973_9BILA
MVFSKNKNFVTLALLFLGFYASNCAHLPTYSYASNGTTIQNSLWSSASSFRTTPSRRSIIVICPIAEVGVEYGGYGFSVIGSNERLDPTAFVVFSFFGIILFFFVVVIIFLICRCYFKKLASVKQSQCHVVPHGDASRSTTRNYRRKIHGKSRTPSSSLIFDQMTEHILRIDRIHRQPQGHLMISGSGKTTFLRFVAWINGIPVFQLKVHSGYTGAHLDKDIHHGLCQACCILDESNMLDTGFLEHLNTLLANGEVPGLFGAEENASVMNQISVAHSGQMLDSNEKLNQCNEDTQSVGSGDSARFRQGQGDIVTDEEKDAIVKMHTLMILITFLKRGLCNNA